MYGVTQVPFKLTGNLNELTLTMDRPKLTLEDMKRLQRARVTTNSANDGDLADFKDGGALLVWSARVADNSMRTGIPRQRKEN